MASMTSRAVAFFSMFMGPSRLGVQKPYHDGGGAVAALVPQGSKRQVLCHN